MSHTQEIQEVTVQKNVPATMRDGTTLMSNVYRPAEEGEYPVLLARLPYGKDQPRDATYFDPVRAAQRGYIVVIQDVRGRYASEGEFGSFLQETEDGHDAVEWAAKLPGSNGDVGMWGLSYYGKTQWHAATAQPPSLKSMAPGQTWGNHLNGASLRGGAQELGLIQFWAQGAIALHKLFREHAGEGKLGEKLPYLIQTIDELLAGGGYDAVPFSKLPDPGDLTDALGLGRGVDDGVWDLVNIEGKYDRIEAPTFHIGGWYDCFIGETLRQYEAMKKHSIDTGLHPPHLLVGPWTHAGFESTQGELDFGITSFGDFINANGNLTDRHLRWFDATLKGEEALANRPPVEVFVMGENRWRGYEEWPVPDSLEEEWFLRGGGVLSREVPDQIGGSYDEYVYDAEDPVPTIGGASLLPPVHGAGAMDQRLNEERQDVLVYTSEPFEGPYTALGPVYATVFAASSAQDTDFVARLVDVHPDGRAIALTDGIIRASACESYPAPGVIKPTKPSPIEPEKVYEYCIDLWATGITFLPEHRLRVEVTSSSFPRWDRNPNTGESTTDASHLDVARQRIFHDAERPSRVTLTVVDG